MDIKEQFSLEGKVAVVTGASKGIGKAIAMGLAQAGAKVVVSSRSQEAVDEVAEAIVDAGGEAKGIACHMGDTGQIQSLVEQTVASLGGIDILVNNAAINPVFGPVLKSDDTVFDKIMQVNVKGPFNLCKMAFPSMKSRGGGAIVNISSIEGISPGQGLGLYSVSKAALISLTKVLANELGETGIRANVLAPGLVDTKFSEALISNDQILKWVLAKQAIKRPAQPEEMVGLALYLASPASSFVTGGVFTADGGYTV
ncbi:MAG TPA: short-chain dehydrogenase [Cytophagales bacterium]|nr:short-chain dehydrogenase [Cytophagales bacterium]HAP61310.1 short-chain dehydrogenase [Cytophagales bacterium]